MQLVICVRFKVIKVYTRARAHLYPEGIAPEPYISRNLTPYHTLTRWARLPNSATGEA